MEEVSQELQPLVQGSVTSNRHTYIAFSKFVHLLLDSTPHNRSRILEQIGKEDKCFSLDAYYAVKPALLKIMRESPTFSKQDELGDVFTFRKV